MEPGTPPPLPLASSRPQPPALPGPASHLPAMMHGGPSAWCPYCRGHIAAGVQKCLHCGEFLSPPSQSDNTAGCLGLLLGPIGLWYKGQWAAGFAWIVGIILVVFGTAGLGVVFAPFFWIGMAIHAYKAKVRR